MHDALSIVGDNALLWAILGQVYFQEVHAGTEESELLEASRSRAGMYSMIDELDESCRWLEHAIVDRSFLNHRFLEEIDPTISNLRSDPRFDQLMALAHERWSTFEA